MRGINVGKAKRIAMADLRALFAQLGFTGVRSLLNSGNVVFTTSSRSRHLSTEITDAVVAAFGIETRVVVLDADDFLRVVEENPLEGVATDGSRLLVSVLRQPADRAKLTHLEERDWGDDAFALGSRAAYLWCPDGVLASDLPDAVAEAVGYETTARNWNTVQKIAAALA